MSGRYKQDILPIQDEIEMLNNLKNYNITAMLDVLCLGSNKLWGKNIKKPEKFNSEFGYRKRGRLKSSEIVK